MNTETKLVIGIAIVQTAITAIGVVIGWKMTRRQIQIMLEQADPAAKRVKTKALWYVYVAIGLFTLSMLASTLGAILSFIYAPQSPRLNQLTLLVNIIVIYFNFRMLRKTLRAPRRVPIDDSDSANPRE